MAIFANGARKLVNTSNPQMESQRNQSNRIGLQFLYRYFAKDKLDIFVNNDLAHQSVLFANECGNYIVF